MQIVPEITRDGPWWHVEASDNLLTFYAAGKSLNVALDRLCAQMAWRGHSLDLGRMAA